MTISTAQLGWSSRLALNSLSSGALTRYTGGTPVTGFERHQRLSDDPGWIKRHQRRRDELVKYLRSLAKTQDAVRRSDDEKRKVDPKASPDRFLFPSVGGNELVDRWDIQATPPDVLVTNYSMLNAMLVREVDAPILEQTRAWLANCAVHVVLLCRSRGPNECRVRVEHQHVAFLGASLSASGWCVAAQLRLVRNRFGWKSDKTGSAG